MGDGTAETESGARCPHCGEAVTLALDPGGGPRQSYVEDCPVCCRPWAVRVRWDGEGRVAVELSGSP
ncbi:MAG: CPXCG motif-containing cysteine-rich protein [Gemmatimonadota bacterium]